MFEQLQPLASDPILGLSIAYLQDTNPNKVDLGVGVYKNEAGITPVLSSITQAQAILHQEEQTKAYQGPAGDALFNQTIQTLIFGAELEARVGERLRTLQAPGGCGALRLAAELFKVSAAAQGKTSAAAHRNTEAPTIWVSTPTWANHIPLLGGAGLTIREYPYYDAATQSVNFDAMAETLQQVPAGDIVLLHGCCHNPCGADLNTEQWQQVAAIAVDRGFVPFIDLAYQGFGDGLDEDVYGVRLLADTVPEMLVASSCSKNFGLYRERTGALSVLGSNAESTYNAFTQMQSIARGIWSMPPAHGAALVAKVLSDDVLRGQWQGEVAEMRVRIATLRGQLAAALNDAGDFSFIPRQRGMFSFLGLSEAQVEALKNEYSVYMVGSSRINIAGISQNNLEYLAASIKAVL